MMLIDQEAFGNYVATAAKNAQVSLNEAQKAKIIDYICQLLEVNTYMNLTAITDLEEIAVKHIQDCWSLVPFIQKEQQKQQKLDLTWLDIGTGAGFPSIPLKIILPELEMTLVDALQKRLKFLETVKEICVFEKVKLVHSRIEDAKKLEHFQKGFEIVAARAVSQLNVLAEYALPYVKVGGIFLAMKGDLKEELEVARPSITILGGEIETVEEFILTGTKMKRSIVCIRKVKKTAACFPRAAGLIKKDPLH